MDDVDRLEVPDDLRRACSPFRGGGLFEALNDSSKRNALRWVKLAKTEKPARSASSSLAGFQLQAKSSRVLTLRV